MGDRVPRPLKTQQSFWAGRVEPGDFLATLELAQSVNAAFVATNPMNMVLSSQETSAPAELLRSNHNILSVTHQRHHNRLP